MLKYQVQTNAPVIQGKLVEVFRNDLEGSTIIIREANVAIAIRALDLVQEISRLEQEKEVAKKAAEEASKVVAEETPKVEDVKQEG